MNNSLQSGDKVTKDDEDYAVERFSSHRQFLSRSFQLSRESCYKHGWGGGALALVTSQP
jgi:hypothetical protein